MASAAQTPSLGERIGEYFTLRSAAATQAKIGEPARKSIESALAIGRQRAEAAEALWSNGHTAEALRLAVESLLDTVKAAPAYGDAIGIAAEPAPASAEAEPAKPPEKAEEAAAGEGGPASESEAKAAAEPTTDGETATPAAEKDAPAAKAEAAKVEPAAEKPAADAKAESKAQPKLPDEPWSRALAARGVPPAKIEKAKAAVGRARDAKLPLLDADVSPEKAELYEEALDARYTIDNAFAIVALPPRDLGWTRFSRIGTTALLASLAVGALLFATHEPSGTFANASDVWNQVPQFAPENVIDGRDDTYWLLPDGATGWVEATISPPIGHVSHVTLLNTHNPPHNDRATNAYTVEIYSGGEVVQSIEGNFEFSTHPEPVTLDANVDSVERIRFVVRSHHNVGAGLAELSWD